MSQKKLEEKNKRILKDILNCSDLADDFEDFQNCLELSPSHIEELLDEKNKRLGLTELKSTTDIRFEED